MSDLQAAYKLLRLEPGASLSESGKYRLGANFFL